MRKIPKAQQKVDISARVQNQIKRLYDQSDLAVTVEALRKMILPIEIPDAKKIHFKLRTEYNLYAVDCYYGETLLWTRITDRKSALSFHYDSPIFNK